MRLRLTKNNRTFRLFNNTKNAVFPWGGVFHAYKYDAMRVAEKQDFD
jgi:hypothetical protein